VLAYMCIHSILSQSYIRTSSHEYTKHTEKTSAHNCYAVTVDCYKGKVYIVLRPRLVLDGSDLLSHG